MEMESYLSKVKKTGERERKTEIVEEKMEKEDAHDFKEEEKEYLAGKKTVFQKFMDFIAGTEEDMPEQNKEKPEEVEDEKELEKYDKKSKGMFNSMKNFFSSRETMPEEKPVEEKKGLPEDIKEVLRIQNRWIAMLPARDIRDFKQSPDYTYYKDTLQKYGLIKVK